MQMDSKNAFLIGVAVAGVLAGAPTELAAQAHVTQGQQLIAALNSSPANINQ
jgi:hypothetical protein